MKYYIIAGEASGDLHGSNLIKALKDKDPQAEIRCWGGELMKEAGGILVTHYKEMAFMGFYEVLKNLTTIFKKIKLCKSDIASYKPDALIFIDFSGFNMRIAKWAKAQGYQTNYYITPQVWASRESRVNKLKKYIDNLYVILPFEKDFYEEKHQLPVHFVGHPLIDAIEAYTPLKEDAFRQNNHLDIEKPIVALLPGSRKQEIQNVLPVMLSITNSFPNYQFVVAGAPSLDKTFYNTFIQDASIGFVSGNTYSLLANSFAALVTSGTATLETALFQVPQVVCYKGNWISYQIAKRIITLDYISLVNLIMEQEVVKELIQHDLNRENLDREFRKILEGADRNNQLEAYHLLRKKLGGKGASEKAATFIVENV